MFNAEKLMEMRIARYDVPQEKYPLPKDTKRALRDFRQINERRLRVLLNPDLNKITINGSVSREYDCAVILNDCVANPIYNLAESAYDLHNDRDFVLGFDYYTGLIDGINSLMLACLQKVDANLIDDTIHQNLPLVHKKVVSAGGTFDKVEGYLDIKRDIRTNVRLLAESITGADILRAKIDELKKPIWQGDHFVEPNPDQQLADVVLAGSQDMLNYYGRLYPRIAGTDTIQV